MRGSSATGCCASTAAAVLDVSGAPPLLTDAPNQVWPADFKGQFKTGDGNYCYPLTVTDHFSRACWGAAAPSVCTAKAKPVLRTLFREVGLPDAIRTHNRAPRPGHSAR